MKRQAAYHGEIGANGKAYQKGQFIAEQAESMTRATASKKGSGKQEVAPYVWAVAPDEHAKSIYRAIAGTVYNIQTKQIASAETIAFLGMTLEQVSSLVARYEDGELWFYPEFEAYV